MYIYLCAQGWESHFFKVGVGGPLPPFLKPMLFHLQKHLHSFEIF